MKIEALTSFCGILSMAQGEVRDYSNETVVSDLLKAGYIKMAEEPAEANNTEKKTKSTTRKAVKASAGK